MSKKVSIAAISAIFIILIAAVFYTQKFNQTYRTEAFAMDTFINVNVTGDNAEETGRLILNAIGDFESRTSMYLEDSDISRINNNAGNSYVRVNEKTYELIKRACELSGQSGGKFDITVGPLVKKWNVTAEEPHIPETDDALLSLINYKDVLFDEENISIMLKNKGQLIDLGGIAKGNISDEIYNILEESDVREAAVVVGGNVIVYGDKSYKTGIKHPRSESGLIATVNLNNRIISTTGDYERYFEIDGKRYHHILDPKTGRPYDGDFYSVTVIGNDGTLCDYLSTALFMTPKEELISLLDTYSIIAVGKDSVVYASPNLDITLNDNSYTVYK